MDNKKIISFVDSNSWLDLDSEEENFIVFSTRDNGNVGDEQYGQKDYVEAHRLAKLIQSTFKGVECEVETCDEWVNLSIEPKECDNCSGMDLHFDEECAVCGREA